MLNSLVILDRARTTILISITLASFQIFSVHAQVIVPTEPTAANYPPLNISHVFAQDVVGTPPATFVDPISSCENNYAGILMNNGSVNCRIFNMGSPRSEVGRFVNEQQHQVYLTRNFQIQATEVTQLQWLAVMGGSDRPTPSYYSTSCQTNIPEHRRTSYHNIRNQNGALQTVRICAHHPVEQVSYDDIVGRNGFLERLNASQTQYTYRLPTEAEWEYAARGGLMNEDGTYPPYAFDSRQHHLSQYAFYFGYSYYDPNANIPSDTESLHQYLDSRYVLNVAYKLPNNYGLYDMHGNVWEWVSDYYEDNYGLSRAELAEVTIDPTGPHVDPTIRKTGIHRVLRGGSRTNDARYVRSAARIAWGSNARLTNAGFRLVRTPRANN